MTTEAPHIDALGSPDAAADEQRVRAGEPFGGLEQEIFRNMGMGQNLVNRWK